jgi:hypothetical protein
VCGRESQEIRVKPATEYLTIRDLRLVALSWLELHLPFEVDVPACKQTKFDILIHGTDRQAQLRVTDQDLIRGLPLPDQRGNNLIDLMQAFQREIDSFAR